MSRPPTEPGNGAIRRPMPAVPLEVADETDTDRIRKAMASPNSPSAHDIAKELWGLAGGGGDGAPPADRKKEKRWDRTVQLIVGIIIAASGALAAYKATEARSRDNEVGVKQNKKAIQAVDKELTAVRTSVDKVDEKIDRHYKVQVQLVEGVESLKKEAQTEKQRRLEDKVQEQAREIRRLEHERRRP